MTALRNLELSLTNLRTENRIIRVGGRAIELTPSSYRIRGLVRHTELCDQLEVETGAGPQKAEVIAIGESCVVAKPFDAAAPIGAGAIAWHKGRLRIRPHVDWKGRSITALAEPIDGLGPLSQGAEALSVSSNPPSPLKRSRISKALRTGVRVVDVFTPLCMGQRIGIFAGSGVGKSTLLSMMLRPEGFDTVIVALVGERGREVREFIESMEAPVRQRTVAVVSTGDQSAMMRRLAPLTAMTVAEYFRDQGENVLLVIDSITRFAHATREIALIAGEPPVARGYPPSVFTDLPRLLERAGPGEEGRGSITGIFSVLIDGDDHNDPVADSIRGTLDGHLVLERSIAEQGRYPSVNPLTSISRLADIAWTAEQRELVLNLRKLVSRFEESRDIRLISGYKEGVDAELDKAVTFVPRLYEALRQSPREPGSADAFSDVIAALRP